MPDCPALTPHETDADARARRDQAEATALWYFQSATQREKRAYDAAMREAVTRPGEAYYTARDAADHAWRTATAAARSLFDDTVTELLDTGEVSEDTAERWQQLEDAAEARARAHAMAQAMMAKFDAAIDAIAAA